MTGPPTSKTSLSYGLNIPKQNGTQPPSTSTSSSNLVAGQKRKKNIFDNDDNDTVNSSDTSHNEEKKPSVSIKGVGGGIKKRFEFGGLTKKKGGSGFGYTDAEEGKGADEDGESKEVEITTFGGLKDNEQKETNISSRYPDSSTRSRELKSNLKLKPLKGTSIFEDHDDENDNGVDQNESSARKSIAKLKINSHPQNYTNLATLHTSSKHAREAESIDPSIYSYDSVYDSIKAQREKPFRAGSSGANGEPSRYMESLLRSAEIRKRDQMRARDRLLAKEREAEGDEFADKDKFVTEAYRTQQEEIRKMEEEEARKEKEEEERRRRNGGSGLTSFYRDMLARGEDQHRAAVKAVEDAVAVGGTMGSSDMETEKQKSETEIAAELNARGANIIVNDEGQIVDKRQLLSAGLNIASKPKTTTSKAGILSKSSTAVHNRLSGGRTDSSRQAQRHRQTGMIAAQLEEHARQEAEEEAARQKELAEKSKSRKTETDVSSARERYLARKREREEVAKKEKGDG